MRLLARNRKVIARAQDARGLALDRELNHAGDDDALLDAEMDMARDRRAGGRIELTEHRLLPRLRIGPAKDRPRCLRGRRRRLRRAGAGGQRERRRINRKSHEWRSRDLAKTSSGKSLFFFITQFGLRFSMKAFGPSRASSCLVTQSNIV